MKLALVRHGEADYAKIGQTFQGNRRDFAPLSAIGERQALEAARSLSDFRATRVVTSPYTRALQTGAIIAIELHLCLSVEPAFHDWLPVRDASGVVGPEVVKMKTQEFDSYYASGVEPPFRSWETLEEIRSRVARALVIYDVEPAIIAVTHEAVIRSLTNLLNVPLGSVYTGSTVL